MATCTRPIWRNISGAFERNAVDEALVKRLVELDLGDAALVFGRIDRDDPESSEIEAFHIGRLAVSDEDREPVVVDWRAPVAEPFYRDGSRPDGSCSTATFRGRGTISSRSGR